MKTAATFEGRSLLNYTISLIFFSTYSADWALFICMRNSPNDRFGEVIGSNEVPLKVPWIASRLRFPVRLFLSKWRSWIVATRAPHSVSLWPAVSVSFIFIRLLNEVLLEWSQQGMGIYLLKREQIKQNLLHGAQKIHVITGISTRTCQQWI